MTDPRSISAPICQSENHSQKSRVALRCKSECKLKTQRKWHPLQMPASNFQQLFTLYQASHCFKLVCMKNGFLKYIFWYPSMSAIALLIHFPFPWGLLSCLLCLLKTSVPGLCVADHHEGVTTSFVEEAFYERKPFACEVWCLLLLISFLWFSRKH